MLRTLTQTLFIKHEVTSWRLAGRSLLRNMVGSTLILDDGLLTDSWQLTKDFRMEWQIQHDCI